MKTIQLQKGELRTLSGDLNIVCGSVWITRENDAHDYVLDAGSSFCGEGYLLEALTDVTLREGASFQAKLGELTSESEAYRLREQKADQGLGLTRVGFVFLGAVAATIRR